MIQEDDHILEHLDREGWGSPELIAARPSIDASKSIIRERLWFLQYARLVTPLWADTYELTTWGALYLRGELDVEHQPRPTSERVHYEIRLSGGHVGSAKIFG